MASSDWARFDWKDPFLLDEQLDDEERLVVLMIAVFGGGHRNRLAPRRKRVHRAAGTGTGSRLGASDGRGRRARD